MSGDLAKVMSLSNQIGGDLAQQASENPTQIFQFVASAFLFNNPGDLHTSNGRLII